MEKVKCECGHVNPHGTILCESCGRALTVEAQKEKLHDMRYEGSARRSQTYNKSIVDKVWNFFSSVKVGVWLIIITLIASSIGTILPQEMYIPQNRPAKDYYADVYGVWGEIYYSLGFHDLYDSVWYVALIALIGVSLVICSIDRVVPLHRALKNQRIVRHPTFMEKQRLFSRQEIQTYDQDVEKVKEQLEKKHYKIREENGNILAEKGRFSRWGPYVNHIGLIIVLIAAMLRSVDGMYIDEMLWIREGETLEIPGTNGEYYLKNNKFTVDQYDKNDNSAVFKDALDKAGAVVKNYQSDVVLYKNENTEGAKPNLKEVTDKSIRVNEPLKFENFAVYQNSFVQDEPKAMEFTLKNKKTNEEIGDVKIDLWEQQEVYDIADGYKIELLGYYPDFDGFAENGEPKSKSPVPNNPAFLFKMISPEHKDGEVSFVAIRQTIEPLGDTEYKMAFKNFETLNKSALTIRKDLTLWIFGIGGLIFMIGVIQGAYWNHRRIWIQKVGDEVYLAGHTNKNWHGLKREISSALEGTSIPEPLDRKK
ncbi:cytochrome c biogenesis protein [Oikeobacillus pervagus]|uniref:Cytochrome c biogenesis protein n=1 Tax=Oikeobacillus pervagus TaxID=1325931 RepID=A0AAJ1WHW1_9BACI|nr:cytochrome c biogenesis protein ResB [Oikeobacillus pervagus]MDQ0213738.1 cytochrome c biogenesis protein [Oikeobacillus pervagus]